MKSELEAFLVQQQQQINLLKNQDQSGVVVSGEGTYSQPGEGDLSERQREVLDCLAAGKSNREIADQLFISENTVKYHIRNIYQILDIKDRKDLLINFRK
ncbi:helix-turn-helix domain-containing protein [Salmonirosea aquatica]|uniref:Winged helix-turn-helix transcriptional regulator n=1 Tax=Salmonirosea aquatica TaxID=2654236 RepID=A0A7C9FPG9_9BACT|nr:winged helix-turn-helix transcriptional regulator [Cytophagaceae bacterium SJW1-29]